MATITIENVPESLVAEYGSSVDFNALTVSFSPKTRPMNRLVGLSHEEIEKQFYNPEEESYGPFVGDENTTFLQSIMNQGK